MLRFWNDDILRGIDNVCQHVVMSADLGEAVAGGGERPKEECVQ